MLSGVYFRFAGWWLNGGGVEIVMTLLLVRFSSRSECEARCFVFRVERKFLTRHQPIKSHWWI